MRALGSQNRIGLLLRQKRTGLLLRLSGCCWSAFIDRGLMLSGLKRVTGIHFKQMNSPPLPCRHCPLS